MKYIFLLFLMSIPSVSAYAQGTYTRIFTYDAAGNRVTMTTPSRGAMNSPGKSSGLTDSVLDITTLGDGILHVTVPGLDDQAAMRVTVYSLSGQVVLRKKVEGGVFRLDVSRLPKGVYAIDVSTVGAVITGKFTKQ